MTSIPMPLSLEHISRAAVLDLPICDLDHTTAVALLLREASRDGECRTIFTANLNHLVRIQKEAEFADAYRSCHAVFADGMPLVWISRLSGNPLPERVTGIDLFAGLCRGAAEEGLSCFLLGSHDDVVQDAASALQQKYPGLHICGSHSGYFTDSESVLRTIDAAAPAILFVAMGSPRQELWMAQHASRLNCRIALAIGGSLDVEAGRLQRAPVWMRRSGLEWFWRLSQEPRRLWRRYLMDALHVLPMLYHEFRQRPFAFTVAEETVRVEEAHSVKGGQV